MSYLSALWLPGTYCPDCGAENVYQTLDQRGEVCLTCARRPEPPLPPMYPDTPEVIHVVR